MKRNDNSYSETALQIAERLNDFLAKSRSEISQSPDGSVAESIVLSLGGFQAQAIEVLEGLLRRDPANDEALARLTFAYMRANQPEAAVESAAQLVSANADYKMTEITTGGRISAYSILGLASLSAGRERAAAEAFEKAFESFEEDSVAWAYLASLPNRPKEIRVSPAAAANPRFATLSHFVRNGTLDPVASLLAASGATSRFVEVSVHGRPILSENGSVTATARDSAAWLIDIAVK